MRELDRIAELHDARIGTVEIVGMNRIQRAAVTASGDLGIEVLGLRSVRAKYL